MASSRLVGAWFLVVLLAACGGSSKRPGPGPTRCEYGGKSYEPGTSFPDLDACNTCSCGDDGEVSCTLRGCSSCNDIVAEYDALMQAAKTCDPTEPNQCGQRVVEGLRCNCDTFVNASGWDAAGAESLATQYREAACGQDIVCGACNPAVTGRCSAAGSCVSDHEPAGGVACLVSGTLYPNGATDVPDPNSCNTCVCDEGRLGCTEIGCSIPCADGTTPGTRCAQCGPADGCEVIETGCLPTCIDDSTCAGGSCIDGVCALVCG
jgi:hypothetical protein